MNPKPWLESIAGVDHHVDLMQQLITTSNSSQGGADDDRIEHSPAAVGAGGNEAFNNASPSRSDEASVRWFFKEKRPGNGEAGSNPMYVAR